MSRQRSRKRPHTLQFVTGVRRLISFPVQGKMILPRPLKPLPAALAALLLAGSLSGAQPQVARSSGSETVWKSETTGHEYRVRIEGDVLRAEWANVPPEMGRQGAYVRTECRKVGTRWVGTTRSRLLLPCTEVSTPDGHHPSAWCSLVTRTEIDTISADRITGRAQAPKHLDCQACKLLDADWKDFTWTPKP
jgi:hypothetical protein